MMMREELMEQEIVLVRSTSGMPWGLQLEYQLFRNATSKGDEKDQWGCFVLVETRPNSPAAMEPDLRVGDVIAAVDGRRVASETREDFAELLSLLHSKGRAVTLTVARPGTRIKPKTLFDGDDDGVRVVLQVGLAGATILRYLGEDDELREDDDDDAKRKDNAPSLATGPEEDEEKKTAEEEKATDEDLKATEEEEKKTTEKEEVEEKIPEEEEKIPEEGEQRTRREGDEAPEAVVATKEEDSSSSQQQPPHNEPREVVKNVTGDDVGASAASRLKFVPLDDELCQGARFAGCIDRPDGSSRTNCYAPLAIGDVLVSLDDQPVVDLAYADLLARLRRPPPTTLRFVKAPPDLQENDNLSRQQKTSPPASPPRSSSRSTSSDTAPFPVPTFIKSLFTTTNNDQNKP